MNHVITFNALTFNASTFFRLAFNFPRYGLFRTMTGVGPTTYTDQGVPVPSVQRPELEVQWSSSSSMACKANPSECAWTPLNFLYKPGDVSRAPPWVAPHQAC